MNTRRDFLQAATSIIAASYLPSFGSDPAIRKPRRLRSGATVGLVNPAGATFQRGDIDVVVETMAALGLHCKNGKHLLDRYGYLAGTDVDRAADVNDMFSDDDVDAIVAVRGGWGCNRILPLIDYDAARKNPKILLGYSDITSLLVALYARAGLVTFHGPVGTSTWNKFSLGYVQQILFAGECPTMQNPGPRADELAQTKDRVETITPGVAQGRLVGGNLSVLVAMMGSPFLPDWKDTILFVEDDNEEVYRIDRMLTQLKLAGVLDKISGFVFGKCTKCGPGESYGSLTLEEVLRDHIAPLNIPSWYGAMIGHIEDKFTMPVGVQAEIDAKRGTIRLMESAVE